MFQRDQQRRGGRAAHRSTSAQRVLRRAVRRSTASEVRARRARPASRCSRTTARTPTRCSATPRRRSSARRRPASAICSTRREINARVSEQVELEHRLRKAVEQGELFLHFQPKFDLATRSIVGVEALMRWRAPDGGLVSPAQFVPVLEQTGLIFEAGQQVARRGPAHLPRLEDARPQRAAHRGQRLGAAAAPQELRRRRARRARAASRPTAAAWTSRSPRAC